MSFCKNRNCSYDDDKSNHKIKKVAVIGNSIPRYNINQPIHFTLRVQ